MHHFPHFAGTFFKSKEKGLCISFPFVCYLLFKLAGRWTINNKLFWGMAKKYGQSKFKLAKTKHTRRGQRSVKEQQSFLH